MQVAACQWASPIRALSGAPWAGAAGLSMRVMPPLPALDPAADPQLYEQGLHGVQVYRGHFLDVRRDGVRLPDGATAHREYIVHPGAVMIVPLLDDGRLVVERQYRY